MPKPKNPKNIFNLDNIPEERIRGVINKLPLGSQVALNGQVGRVSNVKERDLTNAPPDLAARYLAARKNNPIPKTVQFSGPLPAGYDPGTNEETFYGPIPSAMGALPEQKQGWMGYLRRILGM